MPRYVIQSTTRLLVEHAGSPAEALAWFNNVDALELDADPVGFGHLSLVGAVPDGVDIDIDTLEPGTLAAWDALHAFPAAHSYSSADWPSRACPKPSSATGPASGPVARTSQDPPHSSGPHPAHRTRGGYRPISRLVGWLYDVKLEALTARQSSSRDRIDHALWEIAELAQQCADFVERHAKPIPHKEVSRAA